MSEKKNMFARAAENRQADQDEMKAIMTGDKIGNKDKMISVKVNPDIWERFKKINKMCGATSNGMLNQLMTNYVYEKEKELKDLDVM